MTIYLRDQEGGKDGQRKLVVAEEDAIYAKTVKMIKLKIEDPLVKGSHEAIISLEYFDDSNIVGDDANNDDDSPEDEEAKPEPTYAWLLVATGGVLFSGGFAGLLNFGICRDVDSDSQENSNHDDESSTDSQHSVETFQAGNLNRSTDTCTLLGMAEAEEESLSTLAREESISTLAEQDSSSPMGKQSIDENSESTMVFAF